MLGLPPTALDHPASCPRKRERDSVIRDRRRPQSAVTLNPRVFVGRAWGMATLKAGSRPGLNHLLCVGVSSLHSSNTKKLLPVHYL